MKISLISIAVSLLVSTQLVASGVEDTLIPDAKRFGGPYALIVAMDNSGLNSFGSCPSLARQNLNSFKSLINKKVIRKNRLSSIEVLGFNENIVSIETIKEERSAKLYRRTKNSFVKIEAFMHEDTTTKSKDIFTLLNSLNILADSKYSHYSTIAVVVYSNLRQSVSTGKSYQDIAPIVMNSRLKMTIHAASGLDCMGATGSEKLEAEQNSVNFFKSKIISDNLIIKTTY